MKATEQYFSVVLFIMLYEVISFICESAVDDILTVFKEASSAVL